MDGATLREQYRRANQYRELAFVSRPYLGSPGAPAQAETNVSNLWAHLNGGFLMGYEYTHWWEESLALRQAAVLGDWSWLNKVRITGPDASRFMDWISVKSVARQKVGQTLFTPMVSEHGRIAIEGLTLKLDEEEYLFTQSGAQFWLAEVKSRTSMKVELEDVTPDYTCFALQGPRSREVLEEVTGESFTDLRFSHWRRLELFGTEVIVQRQGVTGELGYELLMHTGTGRAHELWRAVRTAGAPYGLRELGFKAQLIGHTESNMPTVIRDFLPDRFPREKLPRFARLWSTEADLAAIDHALTEHLATPAELGWGYTVDLDHDFLGRDALVAEADAGGPARLFRGLRWNAEDMGRLFADQFLDVDAPAPPDLPWGQFRMSYLATYHEGAAVGWASALTYSPTLRAMISHARLDRSVAPGDEVEVAYHATGAGPQRRIRATVTTPPFIPNLRRDPLSPAE
ncbi:glycine cleavage T C-terminal barrel domain-containing protein [Nonomuraea sp. NPDC005650]|uniref:glycine cleavage T C-terminal barrel domain-containing protein n=1 Tax=Nonomuraea sp. NPDC005650 TaxID=3157045 RepID=UPI0033BA3A6E